MDYLRERRQKRKAKPTPKGRLGGALHAIVNFLCFCIVGTTDNDEEVYEPAKIVNDEMLSSKTAQKTSFNKRSTSLPNVTKISEENTNPLKRTRSWKSIAMLPFTEIMKKSNDNLANLSGSSFTTVTSLASLTDHSPLGGSLNISRLASERSICLSCIQTPYGSDMDISRMNKDVISFCTDYRQVKGVTHVSESKEAIQTNHAYGEMQTNQGKVKMQTKQANGEIQTSQEKVEMPSNQPHGEMQTSQAKVEMQTSQAKVARQTSQAKVEMPSNQELGEMQTSQAKVEMQTSQANVAMPSNQAQVEIPNTVGELCMAANCASQESTKKNTNDTEETKASTSTSLSSGINDDEITSREVVKSTTRDIDYLIKRTLNLGMKISNSKT